MQLMFINKMQSPGVMNYNVLSRALNREKEYPINLIALLSLRCLRHSQSDFWFALNGDNLETSEIVLHQGGDTFFIQLRQEDNPKTIKQNEFLKNSENKNGFNLKNCLEVISNLKKDLETTAGTQNEKVKLFKASKKINNFDKIHFIIYTNRKTDCYNFLKVCNVAENFPYLNSKSDTQLFQIDVSKLSLHSVDYINNFYLFANQIDPSDIRNEIAKEIRQITKSAYLENVADDFIKFIKEWSTLGENLYFLTRRDITSKLTELLFGNYEIKLSHQEPCNYEREDNLIWNTIMKDKKVTVIESTGDKKLILDFLFGYIESEVASYCELMKKKYWLDELPEENQEIFFKKDSNFQTQLFKTVGSSNKITGCDVYKCLWNFQKAPLILEIDRIEQYEQIMNVLRLSNYFYKIIIFNNTENSLILNEEIHHFQDLRDLNKDQVREILQRDVNLQGRSGALLEDLLDENMFSYIKTVDIIKILLNNFNIGKELSFVPNYYVTRLLSNPLISYDALKSLQEEIFVIVDANRIIERFAKKRGLKIMDFKNHHLVNATDCNIFTVDAHRSKDEIGMFISSHQFRNVHHLVTYNDHYLIWKQTYGSILNIKKYQQTFINYITAGEGSLYPANNLSTVISAGPGMGKSVLIDSLAQNLPTDRWVLKIDLRKHNTYYESYKNQHGKTDSKEHLNYFKGCLNNKLEEQIFEKLLKSKRIAVLMDGFDEISISYKNEVTEIAKSLYDDRFYVCLTTRPLMKCHLEEEFNVLALELLPFDLHSQRMFLNRYHSQNGQSKNDVIEKMMTRLVSEYKTFRYFHTNDITVVPLHAQMLADVFAIDDEDLDLLNLYKKYIQKKNAVAFDKLTSIAIHDLLRNYQSLLALKMMFPFYKDYIKDCASDVYKLGKKYTQLPDGICLHQTLAEYLAADWLSDNVDNDNVKVKKIINSVFELTFPKSRLSYYTEFYSFLFDMFSKLSVEKGLRYDVFNKNLYFNIILGQVNQAKETIGTNCTNLKSADKVGRTVLHLVVLYRQLHPSLDEIFPLVIAKTPEIREDILGYNPIDYAIVNGLYSMANAMCKKWPNTKINIKSKKNSVQLILDSVSCHIHLWNALLTYCIYQDIILGEVEGYETVSMYLKRHSCKVVLDELKQTKISELASLEFYKKSDLCYEIIFNSADNVKEWPVNKRDSNGNTPLHYAVLHEKLAPIDLLLLKGADANIKNVYEETPLHYSIKSGSFDSFFKLLNKADINIPGDSKYTPLHYAVEHNQPKMIDLLLFKGARIDLENSLRLTPLHLAVQCNNKWNVQQRKELIAVLLSHRIHIDTKNSNGDTLLHCSIICENPTCSSQHQEHLQIVDLLLVKGANVNAKDINGRTPMYRAIEDKNYKIINKLICPMTDINIQDIEGNTPLHFAIHCRHLEKNLDDINRSLDSSMSLDIIDLLLSNGANTNIKNVNGDTPLHLSVKYGDTTVNEKLISKNANMKIKNAKGETPLRYAKRLGVNSNISGLVLNKFRKIKGLNLKRSKSLNII